MSTHDLSTTSFKKADDELHVVFGEVYAPGMPDSQGDYMTAVEIRKMAYEFMRSGKLGNIDQEHNNQTFGAWIVESFIARANDPDFLLDSWVIGVHVPDPVQWAAVKNGTYNGLSLDGEGDHVPGEVTLNIPEWLTGETSAARGHEHAFTVRYAKDGSFLGGETDVVQGHSHAIERGTVTEEADGHTHRFSFVEQIGVQP